MPIRLGVGTSPANFVTLPAKDFEESVHFYGTVLGLPHVKNWGDMPGAEFQAGNVTIAIMDPTAFGQEFRAHAVPVAFQVEDVASAIVYLASEEAHHITGAILNVDGMAQLS